MTSPVDSPKRITEPPKETVPNNLLPIMSMLMDVQKDLGGIQNDLQKLNQSVGENTKKVEDLRLQAAYIKGGLAVAIIAVGLFGWLMSQLIDGRLQAVIAAVSEAPK